MTSSMDICGLLNPYQHVRHRHHHSHYLRLMAAAGAEAAGVDVGAEAGAEVGTEEASLEAEGAVEVLVCRSSETTTAFLRKPDVLAALQRRLQAQFLKFLPPSVQRRIHCLKNLQRQVINLEAKFYEEVHLLEKKYHELSSSLYEKRAEIIKGTYEPTEEESDYPLYEKEDEDTEAEGAATASGEGSVSNQVVPPTTGPEVDDVKGVPQFWLTVFKNIQMWNVSDMVQEFDEPVLQHLQDIKVVYQDPATMGFTVEFHFSPNEYFTNRVLTKLYQMRCEPDEEDPFSFEGPDIYKCKGCTIHWKEGMDVTRIVERQQGDGEARDPLMAMSLPNDSFFNFFSPPHTPRDPDAEIDEETQFLLTSDFAIGHYIRERIVPRAVLYYTGEALISEEYERNVKGEECRRDPDDFKSDYSTDNPQTTENQSESSDKKKS